MSRPLGSLALLAALCAPAWAQDAPNRGSVPTIDALAPAATTSPASAGASTARAATTRPLWRDLNAAQRDALSPLADEWDTLERDRKEKWLEVASKYPQLSAEGKQRLHARMAEFARLTPEQRRTARENFKKAYGLPAEQRQALLEQYNALPPEKKQQLATQATRRGDPARRVARSDSTNDGGKGVITKPTAESSPAATAHQAKESSGVDEKRKAGPPTKLAKPSVAASPPAAAPARVSSSVTPPAASSNAPARQ